MGILIGQKGILLAALLLLATAATQQSSDASSRTPSCPARIGQVKGTRSKPATQSRRKAATKVCGCTGLRTCLLCELHHGHKAEPTDTFPRGIARRWSRQDTGGFRWLEYCFACGLCCFPPDLPLQHAAVRSVHRDTVSKHRTAFVSWYTQETGTCSGELCCGELQEEENAGNDGQEASRVAKDQEGRGGGGGGSNTRDDDALWRDLSTAFSFKGLTLIPDLLSPSLESELLFEIDNAGWAASQSGRLKQEYGPKVNFKEQTIRVTASYATLPAWTLPLLRAVEGSSHPSLDGFLAVEFGALDYGPLRGAAIAPHIDDSWLWGPRIVTFSLLSPVTMGFIRGDLEVRVRLPPRSALVMAGPARYQWLHAIRRQDVTSRRISLTFRELSAEFRPGGGRAEEGLRIQAVARHVTGT